jgi:hypothetical protein
MSEGEAASPAAPGEAELPAGWSRVIVELPLEVPAATPPTAAHGDDAARRTAIRQARERLLAALPPGEFRLTRAFDAIPFVALQVSPEALRALRESPWSGGVEPDRMQGAQSGQGAAASSAAGSAAPAGAVTTPAGTVAAPAGTVEAPAGAPPGAGAPGDTSSR